MYDQCFNLGIPERLWQSERESRSVDSRDSLFRRFNKENYQVSPINSEISASAFSLNNDSYNICSLCESAEDVLYDIKRGEHFINWGVVQIDVNKIDNIQVSFESDKKTKKAALKVIHKPEVCMYPHAEVHIYIDGEYTNPLNTKTARILLKDQLKQNANIVKEPY